MTTTPVCQTCGAPRARDASTSGLCPSCLFAQALAEPGDAEEPDGAPSSGLEPGSAVGPFRIEGLLGTGGMSTVYRAYEAELDRVVALKVLPAEFLHDDTFAQRFRQEARVVAALEHPHIVPVYATGIDHGLPWMSMRMLTGHLGSLIAEGPIGVGRALDVLRAVASALDHAHAHGVVHRDVKPSNILLDGTGHVCVGDFGLAHVMERSLVHTRTGVMGGTPHYMAPEQALGKHVDARTDVYGLGVVAYEMLTGRPPYDAPSPVAVIMKHVNDPLPVPPRDRVPPAILPALQRALAKEPADRWSTASAFVDALEQGASGQRHRQGWAQTAWKAATTTRGLVVVVPLVVALVVALGLWSQSDRQPEQLAAAAPQDISLAPATPQELTEPSEAVQETTPTPTSPPSASAPDDVADEVEPARPVTPPPAPAVTPAPSGAAGNQARNTAADETPPSEAVSIEAVSPPTPQPAATEPNQAATQETSPRAAVDSSDDSPSAPVVSEAVAPPVPSARTADLVEAPTPPPAADPDPVPVEPVVVEPVLVKPVPMPDYPVNARRFGLEGIVRLEATVGVDGRVSAATVVESVHPLLDDAAREVVLRYRYEPGSRDGQPYAFRVPVTVEFKLDD